MSSDQETGGDVRPGRARVSLRVSLIAFSLITIAVTALAVHLPWRHINRENVADMARQLNGEIVAGVDREVAALFDSAVAAQQALHDALVDRVADVDDSYERDRLFFALLRANKHFSWVSFGKPNGDFHGAQRRDERNLRIASSIWSAERGEAERLEVRFVTDGRTVEQTISTHSANDYYAPARAWYRAAVAEPGEHVWTDIYVFDVSRKPGINTAITLTRRGGAELVGVLSIAIELERISQYLAGLTSLRSGVAFIVDDAGFLIAFPDLVELTMPVIEGEAAPQEALRRLVDAHHPLLRLASRGIGEAGIDLSRLNSHEQIEVTDLSGERYFVHIAPAAWEGWRVGAVIPVRDFLQAVDRKTYQLGFAVLGAVLLVGLLATLAARILFIRPLQALTEQTRAIAQFDLDRVRRVPSRLIEIDALSAAMEQMSRGLDNFRRYMPAKLVRGLLDQGVVARLGGERRTVSILFMDIEGFTTATERLGHRVVPLLGEYFAEMTDAIQNENGTLDKFIGDAVMAFWGAPAHDEEHPTQVCRAALACQTRMEALRERWAGRRLPPLRVRVGVNTGRVVVGNIGASERLSYTVVGEPVNLAAMLEAMNKEFGTGILISRNTYELAKFDVLARRIDAVKLKGKCESVPVYELLAMRDEEGEAPAGFEWLDAFDEARAAYGERRWRDAAAQFRAVLAERPEDPPSLVFLARCEERLAEEARAGQPRPAVLALSRQDGAADG